MIPILSALAPVFLISAIGYLLATMKFGGEGMWDALDNITFYLLFPALLAKTLIRADLGSVPVRDYMLVSAGSVTLIGAGLLFAYRALGQPIPGPAFTSFFQGALRFQSTVSVAISATLFGERGLTFAAISVATLVPIVQIYTVIVLLIYGCGTSGVKVVPILQRLAMNPFTLACLLGFVLNLTGVPDFVFDTFSIFGAAAIALTLLSVGAGLNLGSAHASIPLVAVSIVVRLILLPVVVLALSWLVHLTGLPRSIAVIAAAVPTAATGYTMARKMGGDAELMAQIITFQSLASAVTLPLFIYLAQSN